MLISCDNEDIEEEPPFDFVRFEIDGEEMLFTEQSQTPIANTYYLIPEERLDAITIIMQNKECTVELNLSGTGIFSKELPYSMNENSDPFNDGYMGFQLINQVNSKDTANFSGNNIDGFSIVLTSTERDIFRADFEGKIRTKSGPSREKIIRNGKLKVTMDVITDR